MFIDRNTIGGALVGVTLAIGTIAGASALRGNTDAGVTTSDDAGARLLLTGRDAAAMGCQPHESAVAEQLTLRGERVLNTRCVVVSSSVAADPFAGGTPSGVPGLVPAAFAPQAAVLTTAPQAVVAAPPVRQVERAPRTGRTWKKTALVIGGSTAAGAGIGGAIGGRKGALVGAAIGGGGSTLFEAMKRR
jgi:hypothetical protein